eukprot:GEMP01046836.1.p1 GENE.GEMP01046836.1~~GEMP01046836.1.p1  ORF type:complete len:341 (+),score=59.48 GEMP01046836.1:128-1150(+)
MVMTRFVTLALLLCANAIESPAIPRWDEWRKIFRQDHANDYDETLRKGIFEANAEIVKAHNRKNVSWLMELNEFADWTWEEFASEVLMTLPQNCSATTSEAAKPTQDLPDSIDWVEKGAVTEVKDQGQCGSCWTFSTTGVLESHNYLTNGNLTTLSEQQLVDCAGDFNNHGCNGGLPSQAMEYVRFRGGLETEADYPYRAVDGTCYSKPSLSAVHVEGVVNITSEGQITETLALIGPVSIAYEVVSSFMLYRSGVYDPATAPGEKCGNRADQVNHAVLAVGYGHDADSDKDFFKVKNSWTKFFGEDGYFRIIRGVNACGLADCASYPKIVKTKEVEYIIY